MDKGCTISTFRGEREIYVTKPVMPELDPEPKVKKIESNVGGFCGCFTTQCKTKITFDKRQYYLGETAKATIECDNSQCKKDISDFIFKLRRRHWGKDTMSFKWSVSLDKELRDEKTKGIDKGEKKTLEVTMQLPTVDSHSKKAEESVPEHQRALLK